MGKKQIIYGKTMIRIITGALDSGKTTYMKDLYDTNRKGDGILSLKHFENKDLTGYDLLHLRSGRQLPFIRLRENLPIDWREKYATGKYSFSAKAFHLAEEILRIRSTAPVYIDEIGPLEIFQKEGFYAILKELINKDNELFLSVRNSLLDEMTEVFSINNDKSATIIQLT